MLGDGAAPASPVWPGSAGCRKVSRTPPHAQTGPSSFSRQGSPLTRYPGRGPTRLRPGCGGRHGVRPGTGIGQGVGRAAPGYGGARMTNRRPAWAYSMPVARPEMIRPQSGHRPFACCLAAMARWSAGHLAGAQLRARSALASCQAYRVGRRPGTDPAEHQSPWSAHFLVSVSRPPYPPWHRRGDISLAPGRGLAFALTPGSDRVANWRRASRLFTICTALASGRLVCARHGQSSGAGRPPDVWRVPGPGRSRRGGPMPPGTAHRTRRARSTQCGPRGAPRRPPGPAGRSIRSGGTPGTGPAASVPPRRSPGPGGRVHQPLQQAGGLRPGVLVQAAGQGDDGLQRG